MQIKKILSVFLVALLTLSMFVINVEAESENSFELGVEASTSAPIFASPKTFNYGDEIEVKINVTKNTGVSYLKFTVNYDKQVLKLKENGCVSSFLFGNTESVVEKDGYIIYTLLYLSNNEEITYKDGNILTLKFECIGNKCKDTEISTNLVADNINNCGIFGEKSSFTAVKFVPGKDAFSIHKFSGKCKVTAPTCENDGYSEFICENCKKTFKGEIVDKLGHKLVNHEAKAPTCTEIGWEAYETCERCDYTTYKEIPKKGHTTVYHEGKPATCLEDGFEPYETCEVCDYTTYKIIPALNHKLVHHEAQAPSCTEVGWEAYDTCERCDYTTYVEIPANGHKLVHHEGLNPTVDNYGYDEYDTCEVCDYSTMVPIYGKNLETAVVIGVSDTVYSGKAITFSNLSVKYNDVVLKKDVDYTVSYKNNVNAGTATVTVSGLGIYVGEKSVTFKVNPKKVKVTVSGLKKKVYTGKSLKNTVTVKLDGKKLTSGKDYTLTYKNNKKPGKASVKVTLKGNYTGTKTAYFVITTKKMKMTSVKKVSSKNQIKVKWTKAKYVSGYTVQYSENKNFKSAKKLTVNKKYSSKVIKKLSSNKTYYVRIRSYKVIDGKKNYGAWSNIKKVKL